MIATYCVIIIMPNIILCIDVIYNLSIADFVLFRLCSALHMNMYGFWIVSICVLSLQNKLLRYLLTYLLWLCLTDVLKPAMQRCDRYRRT